MNREEKLAALFERTHAGIKPGLALMNELLQALDNPQSRFLSVHVAGTNGKGSVCAMIESVLREAGLRTGRFTSPHLLRVNERICLDGEPISDDALHAMLEKIEQVEATLSRRPTFFETLTALAFLAFAESGVQIAVLETGMGGRLDCTNVVTPLVSVITRIDLDHMAFLGNTLPEIAAEKAGIIKSNRPVVMAPQADPAREVIVGAAEKLSAPLLESGKRISLSGRKQSLDGQRVHVESSEADYGTLRLPLLGAFQLDALATSVCALEQVFGIFGSELSPEVLKKGIASVAWPARCQMLQTDPPLILDVAHNPSGASALSDTLVELFGRKAKGVFVVGHMRDKDAEGFLRGIAPRVAHCICTSVGTDRAMPADTLAALAKRLGLRAEVCALADAKSRLGEALGDADFGCIAGSVYLAGAWLGQGGDPGESL
ncbi:MAG: bifunctional folylpolyglutamate synthase/dihydrofolate synthase [Verrucomicrobia bacterium]|nr:bifunctional folylpolyglutamate synthase/dihydrofolate synthase [Verrucomicrobiota bacterium]MCH8512809.1 bifunctional folylpolyglutamate synthase/dihydrofolate synthase [Kiritimatiellia bacterium]